MGIQLVGASGDIAETGNRNYNAGASQHVQIKPIPWATLGHYRVTHRCTLANTQAANARLFEVRNTHATNLIVATRLQIRLMQVAAGTASNVVAGLDIYKATGFSAVDTTNVVTPTPSVKRGNMTATPAAAAIRGVTAAGAAAGMTGGTITKDAGAFWQFTYPVTAAAATNNSLMFGPFDVFDDVNGTHPFVFSQNEGFEIENRTLNTTSFGYELIVDFTWAEVTAY